MHDVKLQQIFRGLVLISIVLFIFFWLLPFLNLNFSEDEKNILAWYGYGSYIPESNLINWGLFAVWLFLSIGIFFFNRLARSGYLLLIIITTILSFFWGFRILTPLEAGLSSLISMLDGALLCFMYLTKLNEKFISKQPA